VTINDLGATVAAMVEAGAVGGYLDDVMAGMAECFRRWEPRFSAKKYVRALMSDLPRKNCWTIAEYAGDATPGKMQHLLAGAKWDTMGAMAAVRAFVCDHLDDGDAVAILDGPPQALPVEPAQRSLAGHGSGPCRRHDPGAAPRPTPATPLPALC
jgi:hypothetical protein